MTLPSDFLSSLPPFAQKEAAGFLAALNEEAPASIRINPYKYRRRPLSVRPNIEAARIPWSDEGYYLSERPAFTFDPLLHAGYYYVQEASSMFIGSIVREWVHTPAVCLDLCAAPGGKSINLLATLPGDSLLVSNEIIRQRAHILAENLAKFGHPSVVVTNNTPEDFDRLPGFFDVVLVDAPCSGEGMFRKDPAAVQEWSPQNVRMCAARQKDILRHAWDALKAGGLLIYSTCTYNLQENEENVRWMIEEWGADNIAVPVESSWNISPSFADDITAYRFFPHRTKGEGLFVAVLRKPGEVDSPGLSRKQKKKSASFLKDTSPYTPYLQHAQQFEFASRNSYIVALPKAHADTIRQLDERLNILSCGIETGEEKGRRFVPSQALALSIECRPEAFNTCEVPYETAIAYLRKETLPPLDAPKDFVLITYKNEPIGFVKNMDNRANNLYPQPWRIRSPHPPAEPVNFIR